MCVNVLAFVMKRGRGYTFCLRSGDVLRSEDILAGPRNRRCDLMLELGLSCGHGEDFGCDR